MADEQQTPISTCEIVLGQSHMWRAESEAQKKLAESPERLASLVLSSRRPEHMAHHARKAIAYELDELIRKMLPEASYAFSEEVATWVADHEDGHPIVRFRIIAEAM